ncbi:(deoxy)nucleoside triphosphate pyrophosphohydrolase [Arcanobacterium hippocoleae]|uniref:8-oxo-dGTP diphosphatase n=1 Tax=Arcanobacterium hippocoleae TaxID=149017 RepID=A0ABU1T413_9ACTO|nr:(deoxy)nucleoside triphosphate pyrophosphohydrolase [Arcanobacterium hippocoleae]MDR6940113.1 8-oxo-dGTP diphosphatase [Arcanobacterium hippocoleae]
MKEIKKSEQKEVKQQIHVVGAVFVQDQRVLAAQRGAGRSLAGFWEFPGGKIEAGETGPQALARELREELCIEARVGEFVARSVYEYDFGTVTLDAYFCEIPGAQLKLTEHQEIRWLNVAELFSVEWAPADVPIIAELARLLLD